MAGQRLCYSQGHLNTQGAELSDYFANRYLAGDLYNGSCYSESWVGELRTYEYKASDGVVMVWQHAFDLRAFGKQGEDVVILYHYTDQKAFLNIGNLEQTAAQLLASLKNRAHFGEGVYATQHEPAVWGSRLRILLNNYIKNGGDPLRPDAMEAQSVDAVWGTGRGESGHRAAFCIPLIVPRSIAYNIFERLTPDMAKLIVKDSAGQERLVQVGEDYEGRPVHRSRDVWVIVIGVETDGEVRHAVADADSILELLQLRLGKLLDTTADSTYELARRLHGRARYGEAEELYRECLRIRKAKLGEDHPDTSSYLNNLASLLQAQGRLAEAERLYRQAQALAKRKAKLGEDQPDTSSYLNNLASLLQDQGRLAEAEPLFREALEKRKVKLDEDHPDTLQSLNNLALLLKAQGRLAEAEPLFRQALAKRQAKLGEDHPHTLGSLNNLAALLKAQGHLAKAEPLYREVLEKRKVKLDEDHPHTLNSFNNLAVLLQAQGRLAEAEPLYRQSLEKRRLKLGNQHPVTMTTIYNLADLLKSMTKFKEAEELFREELAACIAVHGERHKQTVASMRNLAKFLEERGKVDEAQELERLASQSAQ